MNIQGFTTEALQAVSAMLYAEGDPDPLKGQCDQKKKEEQNKQPRSPEQQEADRARAQANQGQDNVPSAVRSEAAKEAAKTRAKCKGQTAPGTP